MQVCKKVEGEDYGAIGAIFEGDNATVYAAVLNCSEDIFDGGLWCESVF